MAPAASQRAMFCVPDRCACARSLIQYVAPLGSDGAAHSADGCSSSVKTVIRCSVLETKKTPDGGDQSQDWINEAKRVREEANTMRDECSELRNAVMQSNAEAKRLEEELKNKKEECSKWANEAKTAHEDAMRLQKEAKGMKEQIAKSKEESLEMDAELSRLKEQAESLRVELETARNRAAMEKSRVQKETALAEKGIFEEALDDDLDMGGAGGATMGMGNANLLGDNLYSSQDMDSGEELDAIGFGAGTSSTRSIGFQR